MVELNAAQLLRDHGLQVTAQRLAVLRAVHDYPHATADRVAEVVRAEIGAISRQTVYDALGMLSEKDLIRRIQPGGAPAFYDPRVGDQHHHIICRGCGEATDLDCSNAEAAYLAAAAKSGFRIDSTELILWGTCPSCLSRAST